MVETQNAIITDVEITKADHGVLSIWIMLDYGGSGQGFGGYALWGPHLKKGDNPKDCTGIWIWRCMEVAGVESWNKMVGKTVRVRGDWGHIEAIGHIVKDIWFEPDKELK